MNPHVKIQFEINSQHAYYLYSTKLVNPHVKIQFEINSQLLKVYNVIIACESSRKNTI